MQRLLILGALKNPFWLTGLIFAGLYLLIQKEPSKQGDPKISGSWIRQFKVPFPFLMETEPGQSPASKAERKG